MVPARSDGSGAATATSVSLLGVLDVRIGAAEVVISGSLLRLLLVRLAVDAPRAVPAAALIDAVWAGDPPEEPLNALQSLVSRLRRCLGSATAVTGGPGGYRLTAPGLTVDAERFRHWATQGRRELHDGQPELAATTLRRALDLWRGEALADAGGADWARSTRRSLEIRRTDALVDRIDADSTLGRHAALAGELAHLDLQYPVDERFAARLVDALAADGRTAAALAAYEQFRARLADALGTDPSPAMQARHLSLLRSGRSGGTGGGASGGTGSGTGAVPAGGARRPEPRGPDRGALPLPLTTFVGRESDLAGLRALLAGGRLVTIVGAGGCGKTRLATEVAATFVSASAVPGSAAPGSVVRDSADPDSTVPDSTAPDSAVARQAPGRASEVRLVQLAPVTAGGEVPAVVLSALGMTEGRSVDQRGALIGPTDPTRRILDALADREVLLVVDNCEHLLSAVAELTERVLSSCRGVRVLATSREPLAVTGEALWPLAPLAVPDGAVDTAGGSAAVRLFCDRARAARPTFVLDPSTAGDVTQIVRRLDGLPLAIELAAARLRTLPLPQITEGLSDRFRLLTGGSRTALPRHRTLRAVVEWSWDLLTDTEREVAEAISVFTAGVTAASARSACRDGGSEADIAEVLGSLVDKSLLTVAAGTVPRYRMLETLREFGIERLSAQGRLAAARDAQAHFFADLTARAEPHLRTAGQLPWIRVLVAERENVAAAIRHLASSGAAARVVSMVARLSWFWVMADWHTEADAAMSAALEAADAVADAVALGAEATEATEVAGRSAEAPDAVEVLCLRGLFLFNAAALGRPSGPAELAATRAELAGIAAELDVLLAEPTALGDWPRSLAMVTRPVLSAIGGPAAADPARWDRLLADPVPWVAAVGHVMAAAFAQNDGDVATLRVHAPLGLAALRPIGERWALLGALRLVAQACIYDGDLVGAADALTEALHHGSELAAEFGTAGDEVFIELELARVLRSLGDLAGALRHVRAATRTTAALPDLRAIATDALLLQILEATGDTAEMPEVRARIAVRLAERSPDGGPFGGHEIALALTIGASIDLDDGEVDGAAGQLVEALAAAVETADQPVIAGVGVVVARLLEARGEPGLAARAVGAATLLRGAPDGTDHSLTRLLGRLRAGLGPDEVDRLTTFAGDRAGAVEFLTSALQP